MSVELPPTSQGTCFISLLWLWNLARVVEIELLLNPGCVWSKQLCCSISFCRRAWAILSLWRACCWTSRMEMQLAFLQRKNKNLAHLPFKYERVKVLVAQSCPTLCYHMDCNPPGSSVHGISQARILEWVAIPFSRGSSWVRDQTWVSRIVGRFFRIWNHQERVIKSKAIYFHLLCPSTWFTPDILLPVNSTFFFKMKLSSS